jgi:hypothetical protein
MANWRPVDVRLWDDRKFLACGDQARLLWLFLLTCPSLPIPGVVIGGDAALAELLGWLPERFLELFREVSQSGLQVRRESRLLWLPNGLKYQPPMNPNMVIGWSKKWDDVPEGDLKCDIWEALRISCKRWSILFAKLFQKPSRNGLANGSGNHGVMVDVHEHYHQHDHDHDHDQGGSARTISGAPALVVPSTNGSREAKIGAVPVGESGWSRRQSWWQAMLDADARIKASGIEPNAPSLPKNCAGEHEKNVMAVERTLTDSGFSADEVDAKMRHIVLVREAEAKRPGGPGRKYFKPSTIWNPANALRAADTSLEEATTPAIELVRIGERNGAAPSKDPRFGRLDTSTKTPENYGKGEQKF